MEFYKDMNKEKINLIDNILDYIMWDKDKRATREGVKKDIMSMTPNEMIDFICDVDDAFHDIYNIIHCKEV